MEAQEGRVVSLGVLLLVTVTAGRARPQGQTGPLPAACVPTGSLRRESLGHTGKEHPGGEGRGCGELRTAAFPFCVVHTFTRVPGVQFCNTSSPQATSPAATPHLPFTLSYRLPPCKCSTSGLLWGRKRLQMEAGRTMWVWPLIGSPALGPPLGQRTKPEPWAPEGDEAGDKGCLLCPRRGRRGFQ